MTFTTNLTFVPGVSYSVGSIFKNVCSNMPYYVQITYISEGNADKECTWFQTLEELAKFCVEYEKKIHEDCSEYYLNNDIYYDKCLCSWSSWGSRSNQYSSCITSSITRDEYNYIINLINTELDYSILDESEQSKIDKEAREEERKRQILDNEVCMTKTLDEFKKIREENYKDCNSKKN